MNHSTNQEKMPLLFLDEQGRSVSFDNINNMGVVPKNLIPQSKIQLINTLLHRLEKQNELLLEQRNTQSYLGGLSDGDELDELDELIAVMVNEVDFANLSTIAKDKLINSLLRRVKKHQKLIANIKKRNLDERERLKAVEVGYQHTQNDNIKATASKAIMSTLSESEVTDSFVELLSGSMTEPDPTSEFKSFNTDESKTVSGVNNHDKPVTLDTDKYADYFAEIDAQQELRRQQADTLQNQDSAIEKQAPKKSTEALSITRDTVTSNTGNVPAPSVVSNELPFYDHSLVEQHEDDEEEDEDESQYLFDLKEHYEKDNGLITQNRTVIEVVMMRFGEVVNVEYVNAGETYRTKVAGKKYKLIQNGKNDEYHFFYDAEQFEALLIKGDNADPLLLNTPGKIEKCEIPNDGVIRLNVGNVTYLLKRVAPIASPDVVVEKNSNKPLYQSLLGSAIFHFLMLLIGSLFVTLQLDMAKEPEPQFVSVDIEKLQPKVVPPKPPAPKVAKPIDKPKPKVVPPKPKAKPAPKPKAAPKQVAKKANNKKPASTVKVNVKKSGLLASLGTAKGKKSSSQALAKVTNLNAVSSLNSQSASVKVGGLSAKVANSRVSIPSGPSFDAQGSMVSGEGRGNIAALNRGDVASGVIRGKVTASLTKKAKIGGGLSREAVKKVIDANMAAVTYCYEKALVGNSNLSGKAVFEWKILQNGKVGQVGIQSSTLRSNKLHSCIKGAIKGWQFPQPKGVSSTTVSYPFIFNMVGF